MRDNYWTNTKFADWVRGINKPIAATASGWSAWRKEARNTHPFRYWIAEDAFGYIQDFINWPADKFNSIRYYISNRWIVKSHALTSSSAHIKRGEWCDLSERVLLCLFDELVDFVEIETASHNCLWDNEMRKKYPKRWQHFLPWNKWRSPESGIAHLEWSASLVWEQGMCINPNLIGKPTPQALAAKEVLDLYYWWKEEYPNRVEPMELSGWSAYCNERRKEDTDFLGGLLDENKTPAERARVKKMLKVQDKIEKQYKKEEEDMLIRLIKIRHYLWT